MVEDPAALQTLVGFNNARTLLTIARAIMAGELRLREREDDPALAHLGRAVQLESSLPYMEPPNWFTPHAA